MRVGFVGLGRIGAAHAAVIRDHPDVDRLVVADADPDPTVRKVAAYFRNLRADVAGGAVRPAGGP